MAVTLQNQGQLSAAIDQVYRITDEPKVRAKYSPANIIDIMIEQWPIVIADLYGSIENPPMCTFSLAVTANQQYYQLPACIGEVQRLVSNRDTATDIVLGEFLPRHRYNPYGRGWSIEAGNLLKLQPIPQANETWGLEYLPSGDTLLGYGQIQGSLCTTTSIQLPTVIGGTGPQWTAGALDKRPNAYAGCAFSLIGHETNALPSGYVSYPVQDRIIDSYDVTTGKLTLRSPLDFDPSQSVFSLEEANFKWHKFEIYPLEAVTIWPVITRAVARILMMYEANANKAKILLQLEQEAKTALLRRWANFNSRVPRHQASDVADNRSYGSWW